MNHRVEISGHYGYVWTGSRTVQFFDQDNSLRYGDVDIEDSSMWGIQLDIPVQPDAQFVLLYNRQESEITVREGGFQKTTIGDVVTEYWHVGGLGGVPQGRVFPYSMVTIGGTRYSSLNGVGDQWKFSLIFGLGAKFYVNDRIALKVQGRIPYTFFSGGLGVGVGTGGVGIVAGGSGLIQGDLSAGLSLLI
jgi:opacity protein-like surface antigen